MTDPLPAKLRELLLNEFSEEELKALCASIEIDYDKLAGTGTFGKTRSLIDTVKSQDKLRNLQAQVRELRPAAYEAAGFTSTSFAPSEIAATSAADMPAASSGASRRAAATSRSALWPWIALAGVILVCLIAGVALLVPRLQPARQPAMTLPAVETPTLPAVNLQAATETPPAIVEVTDALDKGAGDMTLVPTMDPNAPATATPVAPALTPATGTTPSGEVVTATAGVLEQTATAPAAPTATPTDTHPAVAVVGDLNAQLPRFYRGEVDVQAIQEHWTGEALRSVVGFGTLRLPRAMQIRPDQRNTLEATYVYRNGPTLTRETRDGAIATSREYWRYSTSANATEICETRDYVYSLVRVDGKYKVSEFSSRLVDSGCSQ